MAAKVIESAMQFVITPSQDMQIYRLRIEDGRVTKRELWIADLADIVVARLEQHIRHARMTGGQV